MSTTSDFAIEINDEVTLTRDSMVEHAEHGPMRVDSITISPHQKRAQLQSELGPIGLELSEEELRKQWGETIAQDPFELHDPGSARYSNEGINVEGLDVEVSVTTEGAEAEAETVQMHAIDQIVRAMQAMRDEVPPEECDGADYSIDWERRFEVAQKEKNS